MFDNVHGRHVVVYRPNFEKLDMDYHGYDWNGDYVETMSKFNWDLSTMLQYTDKIKDLSFSQVPFNFDAVHEACEEYDHINHEWKSSLCYGDLISVDGIFYFFDRADESMVEIGKPRNNNI